MAIFKAIVGVLWALAFLAAAAVQYNDPDPFRWVVTYGGAALVSVGSEPKAVAHFLGRMRGVWVGVCLLGAASSLWACNAALERVGVELNWSEVFGPGGMMAAGVEEMRESLGLLIVASRLGWLLIRR